MRGSSQKLQFQWLGAPLLVGLALCLAVRGYRWRATELPPVVVKIEEHEAVERAEWFYEQRAYPLTAIPSGARWHAVEQLEQEEIRLRQFRAARTAASLPTDAPANTQPGWQPLGPAPIGQGQTFGTPRVSVAGRVSALALAPGDNGTTNQTVYLGAAQGGVWRSRDNGATWTALTDDQPSQVIGALALDPANANVIYAGTGEGNPVSCSSYYGAGLLKSTDGGATWTQIPGPTSAFATTPAFVNAGIARIAIDPVKSSTIYLCTTVGRTNSASAACTQAALLQRGVWKSTDGGASWQNLDPSNSGGSTQATDLVIDPLNHDRVFAALLNQGIYRSTGGGEPGTWQKLTNGLPANGFQRIALASGPPLANAANITLYAAFSAAASRNLLGIYKSTDGGANWNQVTTPQLPGQADYNLALAVDPVDANIVYYGTSTNSQLTGGTFWKSTDGGQSWTDQSRFLHPDTHVIAISAANRNLIFTGNDGGVWRTENALAATIDWTSLNQTLPITQFQTIALHPTDPNILLGGTQDNGTNRYNGNATWEWVAGGDGGFAVIDQANPAVVYHTVQNSGAESGAPSFGPRVSFTSGNLGSWREIGCRNCTARVGGFNPTDRVSFYAPMAGHSGFSAAPSGNVIYFGTHRLYRTANQGTVWTGLGASADGFGSDLTRGNGYLSAIAPHPLLTGGDPPGETVWVGTSDGFIQVTTNAGALANAIFTNVSKAPLPNRFVTDIVLDPADQRRAFVTFSGFAANTPGATGHVFMTSDLGASWTDISGNLPDMPVNSIALDPLRANTLFIGTDLGVFQTIDGGHTWERLGAGMPKLAVFMLRHHAPSNSLVAATHGRGVYRLPLPGTLASVSAASYSAASLASEALVSAFGAGLATRTESAMTLPLPTTLADSSVIVRDSAGTARRAPLFFVSPGQINYQLPSGTVTGTALVTVVSNNATVAGGTVSIATVAPGLFTANADGQGAPAAVVLRVKPDGAQSVEPAAQFNPTTNRYEPAPIDLGAADEQVFVIGFGTGFRQRSALAKVNCTLGGVAAEVSFAGAQGELTGLDQFNLIIPRSLSGRGAVELVFTVDGRRANTVTLNFK